MTDRELLELAAKAAGLPECGWMGPAFMYVKDNTFTDWNPLTDDADAFALMVTLGLVVHVGSDAAQALFDDEGCAQEFRGDPAAATRRVIVRAAAEIGARK